MICYAILSISETGGDCVHIYVPHTHSYFTAYTWWRRGAVGRVSDLRARGRGFESRPGTRHKNSGQVPQTYVPLSPSSTSWYRPKGGDALRLESKGRYGLCVGGR